MIDSESFTFDEHGHQLFPLSDLQLMHLKADLNPARIANRSQGGAKLSYLEAYDDRATLNRIFGFGGWSGEATESKVLKFGTYTNAQNKEGIRVVAQSTYRLHIHQLGATYSGTAVASQSGNDEGEVADFAMKTAESDAFKRCCTNLGTQFGLSLYNDGSTSDVVGNVIAPGQRMIDQDLAKLERLVNQIPITKRMTELTAALQSAGASPTPAPPVAPADEANPGTGDIPGGQRAPEETPPGVDPAARAEAESTLAAGFKTPESPTSETQAAVLAEPPTDAAPAAGNGEIPF